MNNQPSPQLFFETANAYQRSAAIKAAIELDIFTAIAEGASNVCQVADKTGASERGVRILCDYLVIIGFLTKEQQSYQLTPESAMFLDRRSPAYLGGSVQFLLTPMLSCVMESLSWRVIQPSGCRGRGSRQHCTGLPCREYSTPAP